MVKARAELKKQLLSLLGMRRAVVVVLPWLPRCCPPVPRPFPVDVAPVPLPRLPLGESGSSSSSLPSCKEAAQGVKVPGFSLKAARVSAASRSRQAMRARRSASRFLLRSRSATGKSSEISSRHVPREKATYGDPGSILPLGGLRTSRMMRLYGRGREGVAEKVVEFHRMDVSNARYGLRK